MSLSEARHLDAAEQYSQGAVSRAVLVTGASGGIGRACCRAFGEAGWWVGVHYCQNEAEAALTLQEVTSLGAEGQLYQANVRNAESVHRMIEAFSARATGSLSLVCNAGIAQSQLVLREREETWNDTLETNLTGVFYCLRAFAAFLLPRGGGSIIVVGSHAGVQGGIGQAAYAASKAGLLGLVKTAAQEWGADNIRVNLLLPGWHKTHLTEGAMPVREWTNHALRRPPSRDEIARTIVHLAGLEDVSGQVWNCDSRHM
ncbi:MAG: SDR family oxidoreductase [Nitrospiraceae bacterium]|nr:SDR family oxidoreductase [Nitrospiraceae bacterium]